MYVSVSVILSPVLLSVYLLVNYAVLHYFLTSFKLLLSSTIHYRIFFLVLHLALHGLLILISSLFLFSSLIKGLLNYWLNALTNKYILWFFLDYGRRPDWQCHASERPKSEPTFSRTRQSSSWVTIPFVFFTRDGEAEENPFQERWDRLTQTLATKRTKN